MRDYTMRIAIALALAASALSPAVIVQSAYAQQSEVAVAEDPRLHAWFEAKFEEQLMFSPLFLSQLGRKERYGEIDDLSDAQADRQLAWQRATVEELRREFPYERLSAQDKLA